MYAHVEFRTHRKDSGQLKVPVLKTSHCHMDKVRVHPRLSVYANSDIFVSILFRLRFQISGQGGFLFQSLPDWVEVFDEGWFDVA